MASTDVLHMSSVVRQSVFVCMRDLFIGAAGCLNTPHFFIYTSPIPDCPEGVLNKDPHTLQLCKSSAGKIKNPFRNLICISLREV